MKKVSNIATGIYELELKYNLTFEEEEKYFEEKVNFSLAKVVYEWASQKTFAEICELTDAQEGSIVRTILRLDILLRNMKTACKVMGKILFCFISILTFYKRKLQTNKIDRRCLTSHSKRYCFC